MLNKPINIFIFFKITDDVFNTDGVWVISAHVI